ncbi:uncharacterized protein LOC113126568 isoform X2 [Mastacembelus armatus]|nr:uncharacterized protein LOC113126568 isoform X2 [Mastacembelus armatus]
MLRTLEESQKSRWKEHLNKVVHAYNSTVNESTGFSPFFLLFGREPTLPIDLRFPKRVEERRESQAGYAEKWREVMQEAYAIAMQNMKKSARRGQKNYNQRTWSSALKPGDHVLVRNLTPRGGPGKLRSYWEDAVHVVKEKKGPGSPVYVVEPLLGSGRKRVLHRNLLLPCPYLVEDSEVRQPSLKSNQGQAKQTVRRNRKDKCDARSTETDSSSEGECYLQTVVRHASQPLNAETEEFQPRIETPRDVSERTEAPAEHSEEEHAEQGDSMEGEEETQVVDTEDEHEAETWRNRPKRVRQPRCVYTYDQLGQPTFQQLRTCPYQCGKASRSQL